MSPQIGDGSAYFHVVNRGKSFIQLDIRDVDGRAELERLLADADVFVTNLRPSKLATHDLNADAVLERHPRLIHAALSAYGEAGDERDRAGYDAVLQARTGIAHVTGSEDGPRCEQGCRSSM
jgi:formyl-CoA transferase